MWKYKDNINRVLIMVFSVFVILLLPLQIITAYQESVGANVTSFLSHDELWFKMMFEFDGSLILFIIAPILIARYSLSRFHKLIHTDAYINSVDSRQFDIDLKSNLKRSYIISSIIYLGISLSMYFLVIIAKDQVNGFLHITGQFVVVNALLVLLGLVVTNIVYTWSRLRYSFYVYIIIVGITSLIAWFLIGVVTSMLVFDTEMTPWLYKEVSNLDTIFSYFYTMILLPIVFYITYRVNTKNINKNLRLIRRSIKNIKPKRV